MIAAKPSLRFIAATCSAACLLVAADAAAQDLPLAARTGTPARTAVFATGGYNTQTDDESSLGRGIGVSGGVGYRVSEKLWIEGVVARFGHRRDLTYYTVSYDAAGHPIATPYPARLTGAATYALAQARYIFSSSRVRPYVAGAIGLMHYSGNGWGAVFPPEAAPPPGAAAGLSLNAAALGATGGADIAVAGRMALGPYVGLLLSNTGESGTKYLLHGGMRLAFGW